MKQRTQKFAEAIVRLCREATPAELPNRIRDQLVGCGTGIGSNYRAACRAKSHPDYTAKITTVVEEADETVYFLDVVVNAGNIDPLKVEFHRREAGELLAIFARSLKTAKERERQSKNRGAGGQAPQRASIVRSQS